jgi:DNA ligase-1
LKYSLISDTYEKIETTSKRLEMTDHLVDLFNKTPNELIDKVIYLTQGKLYPDYKGVELGFAEKLTLKAINIGSGRSSNEIQRIYKETGDLGKTAERILSKKTQLSLLKESLTVEKVYHTFDKIAHSTGAGAIETKVRLLVSLFNNATPSEAKYIARMAVGKDTKKNLERGYDITSDLGYLARTVAFDGIKGVNNIKVTVGRPIRPMLAERLSDPKEILDKLGGEGSVEYKYDGLRIQAHIDTNEVNLFSRRLENITDQFPDIVDSLKNSIKVKAIVEGECIAVNPNTGEALPFQMISQRRGRKYEIKRVIEEIPVLLFLFDLLFFNRNDCTLNPYLIRRKKLKEIVKENERIKISWQHITKKPDEIDKFMDKAISDGCEGLMIKSVDSDSIYRAGARGWAWIKYKRGYKAEMADTVDLVVVGAFYGRGKRAGQYGAFLLAAYDNEEDIFKTVCKCGTGFTDEDLKELLKKLNLYLISHKHPRVDSKLDPDVWLNPSLVLEVMGDEITLSPIHTACMSVIRAESGLAIRFPRFTGNYRTDKSAEDATSTKEILEMYRKQLKKLS